MLSKEEKDKKVAVLQENLSSIRKIAGWSMQQLADEIGVSKQTINNWEKATELQMNFTQYIAIRAVLDHEIKESDNKVLGEVVAILLDSEIDTSGETYKTMKEKIEDVAEKAATYTGFALAAYYFATVTPVLKASTLPIIGAAAGVALGPLGLLGGGATALTLGLWLGKMRKKKK